MSHERPSAALARRNEALERFKFEDPEAVPVATATPFALEDLRPSSAIVATGYLPVDATRFSVDLRCRNPRSIALHLSPRLDRGYVARNCKLRGRWQEEETCSPPTSRGHAFRRGAFFHLTIFCARNEFQIAVDGEHFCAFAYRLPLADVAGVELRGDAQETRLRRTSVAAYPDPRICRPARALRLPPGRSLDSDLELPAVVELPGGLDVGCRLEIGGRLKLLPHSFYINLQRGRAIHPHPAIALHLNPRYHYGNAPSCLVMNSWSDGAWGREERHHGQTWSPGREFLLTIRCEQEAYAIWLGGRLVGEFRHRLRPSIVDTVRVTGDLVLHRMLVCR